MDRVRGLRAVAEALRSEDFPMDRQGIDYAVGNIEVENGRGGSYPYASSPTSSENVSFAALRRSCGPSGV